MVFIEAQKIVGGQGQDLEGGSVVGVSDPKEEPAARGRRGSRSKRR